MSTMSMEAATTAETFVESWQSFAIQTADYSRGGKYSVLLTILVETDGKEEVELNFRGNQPLLRNHRLGDQDVDILVKTVSSNPATKIIALDLSYNALTDASMDILSECIKDPSCTLQSLNLGYNDIGPAGAETLAAALQFNNSVTSLSLGGCKIGHSGGIHIASMLQVNSTIRKLDLSSTDLDTDCVIAIATVLHGNRSLTSIDLSRPLLHSKFEETTIHISKMLQVNNTLSELHMSNHGITDTGAEWLCRMLRENTSLQCLDISSNKLSRDGAHHLSVLLQHNTPLTELDISYNRIEDEGLTNLSTALARFNTTLTRLRVCHNSIQNSGLCALAEALKANTTLTSVSIWGNKLGEPACNAYRDLLETSRLLPGNVDVRPYEVDGITYLSRTN